MAAWYDIFFTFGSLDHLFEGELVQPSLFEKKFNFQNKQNEPYWENGCHPVRAYKGLNFNYFVRRPMIWYSAGFFICMSCWADLLEKNLILLHLVLFLLFVPSPPDCVLGTGCVSGTGSISRTVYLCCVHIRSTQVTRHSSDACDYRWMIQLCLLTKRFLHIFPKYVIVHTGKFSLACRAPIKIKTWRGPGRSDRPEARRHLCVGERQQPLRYALVNTHCTSHRYAKRLLLFSTRIL